MDDLVKAELDQLRQLLRGFGPNDPTAPPDLDALRKGQDALGMALPLPDGLTLTPLLIDDHLPAERHAPKGGDWNRAILHLHGGGYVFGSPRGHRGFVSALAVGADCIALAPDYRLAPEDPYPAAVDDALTAFRSLLSKGFAPDKIVVTGDSAGGGLAMALGLRLREEGLPQPGGYALLSPWVDLTQSGESYVTKARADFMVTKSGLDGMAAMYLGQTDPKTPQASPLFADLSGFPEVYIQVGSEEALLSDATQLAAVLGAAKAPVMLEIWPDMPHVFQVVHNMLTPGREAVRRLSGFIRAIQGAKA